jgi:hypothetical protein
MAGDTSGVLELATNGSTTAVTVDASQNVGIGTASPTKRLSVEASTAGITLTSTTGTNNSLLQVTNTGGSFYVGKDNSAGSDLGTAAYASVLYSSNAYPMVFATNSAERMRITSSGQVFIGDTTGPAGAAASAFYVKQPSADNSAFFASSSATAGSNYGLAVKYTAASPNGTGNEFFAAIDSSVTRMTVRSNGGIANYSGNNVNLSDQREKTNIELAGSYIDKICAIPVKTFNYIDQNMEEDGGLTLGVIAQDVQAVAPELVSESNWGTEEEPKQRLSIYQTDLQYALMKCIQEQQTIINDLKARITALEGAA